jgi:exodeoxyribonuclease VII large subunit
MSESKTLSVTRLVRRMRNLLEIEMGELWVEGEVSNLRKQSSGHLYFTLKDAGAQISCVLFKGNLKQSKVQPEDGMQVKVFGEISVYEARGSVQLIIKKVESAGEGELQAQFDRLKNKLKDEGLFDEDKKLPIPKFPQKVGLITSETGAALQDMLNVLSRRAPWVQPILYPVQVQGKGAERGIAKAINEFSNWEKTGLPQVDVIIIGRGGGSLEDLWNFNEEIVARAIFACEIPIVSAVGHEIDFTISDFVADMRAPTPSAAAELVVPDGEALSNRLERMNASMSRVVSSAISKHDAILKGMSRGLNRSPDRVLREPLQRLIAARKYLDDAVSQSLRRKSDFIQEIMYRMNAQSPESVLARRMDKLEHLSQKLTSTALKKLDHHANHITELSSLLRTLGPESVFARGFSVTLDANGSVIKDAKNLKPGDTITTRFHKGKVSSKVT